MLLAFKTNAGGRSGN